MASLEDFLSLAGEGVLSGPSFSSVSQSLYVYESWALVGQAGWACVHPEFCKAGIYEEGEWMAGVDSCRSALVSEHEPEEP